MMAVLNLSEPTDQFMNFKVLELHGKVQFSFVIYLYKVFISLVVCKGEKKHHTICGVFLPFFAGNSIISEPLILYSGYAGTWNGKLTR